MNTLLNGMKQNASYKTTENGAIAVSTTSSALYDMFALGGAYRSRSDEDCILLFKQAYDENPVYALKCLFYLRDARGGQGERRFFRVCMKWLAQAHPEAAKRNIQHIAEFGRWDDLYQFVGTKLETEAMNLMKTQLALDVQCKTPSLLAKWLKSENTSSADSRALATKTRKFFGMTPRQYRKTLSILRERIKVLERLMSAGRWDEIEFDKIPSKAGLVYRNAFARRDMIKAKYEAFAKDENTKVNAKTLYPYEVVKQAIACPDRSTLSDTNRLMINKYWANLANYFNGATLNALAVVDTSGSMTWGRNDSAQPIDVAISLGLYCAEKAKGPFAGHYVSFSSRPQLIETKGVDFVDKVKRIYRTNLCENTNLEATFDMLLATARANHCSQADLPETIIVISDMEIDSGTYDYRSRWNKVPVETTMETIRHKWENAGYTMPKLVYWNVAARNDTILDRGPNVSLVSGFSPVIFEQIMNGKTGYELMMDKLDSPRYEVIK
jgi:AraC-like DNA-binding protein